MAFIRSSARHHHGDSAAAGPAVAVEALDDLGDAAGVGFGQGKDLDRNAELRLVAIQAFDERSDHAHVIDRSADDQGIDPGISHHRDRFGRLAFDPRRAVGKESLQRALQLGGRGLFEDEHAEAHPRLDIVAVQLLDHAVDHVETFPAAGDQEHVGPVIGDHRHRNGPFAHIGAGLARPAGAKELFEHGGQAAGPGVLQRVKADVAGLGQFLGVDLPDDLLDHHEVFRAGRDDQGVAARIDRDRHALRAVDCPRPPVLAWAVKPLLDQAAEHVCHALRIGKFQGERLHARLRPRPARHRSSRAARR